jgi:hypothetical protein
MTVEELKSKPLREQIEYIFDKLDGALEYELGMMYQ